MNDLLPKSAKALLSNDLFLAFYDTVRPASKGHVIIVSKQAKTLNELNKQDRVTLFDMAEEVMSALKKRYGATGFNVGMDIGASAGQVVNGLLLHIIPRYDDGNNMRGGMRCVVPERPNPALGSYRADWDT